jgi:hypothetical protein
VSKPSRLDVWVIIVAPMVVLWLLLLFDPARSGLALGERVGAGMVAIAVWVPLMWFRIKN